MPLTLVVPPAAEPVSLADAKAWLRIDGPDEDSLLPGLIQAARQAVKRQARTALIAQQWTWTLDAWPPDRILVPPLGPLRSLDAVQVLNAAGALVAAPLTAFQVDPGGLRGRIAVNGTVPDPGLALAGIVLTLRLGVAAAAMDVPAALRQAVLLTLAQLHENRGDAAGAEGPVPPAAQTLLSPWRARRI